MYFYFNIVL